MLDDTDELEFEVNIPLPGVLLDDAELVESEIGGGTIIEVEELRVVE